MDKRVILAVAGSGKTYYICHELNPQKRNLIIAYTNQNIKNIYSELVNRFGFIPKDTVIMTFHSFLYKFMIRPFDFSIGEFYGVPRFKSKGVSLIKPPEPSILHNGYRRANPRYAPIGQLEHFIIDQKYYCDLLSTLIIKTERHRSFSLLNSACDNINRFFDNIYIDEMQDFREDNWKLLQKIIDKVNNILLVGDYYQHSVNALNNCGIPFQNRKVPVPYQSYITFLQNIGLEVDTTTLIKSRRCSKDICEFVTSKLNISIDFDNDNSGQILWTNSISDIKRILDDDNIIKLVWELSSSYKFKAVTWGYSKGDTYNDICVILTDSFSNLDSEEYSIPASISVNKLYVALTRSKGNVYIVKRSDFNLVKDDYLV